MLIQSKTSQESKTKSQDSSELLQLRGENRNLKDRLSQLERQLQDLENHRSKSSELDALSKENNALKSKLADVEKENTRLNLKVINTGMKR